MVRKRRRWTLYFCRPPSPSRRFTAPFVSACFPAVLALRCCAPGVTLQTCRLCTSLPIPLVARRLLLFAPYRVPRSGVLATAPLLALTRVLPPPPVPLIAAHCPLCGNQGYPGLKKMSAVERSLIGMTTELVNRTEHPEDLVSAAALAPIWRFAGSLLAMPSRDTA